MSPLNIPPHTHSARPPTVGTSAIDPPGAGAPGDKLGRSPGKLPVERPPPLMGVQHPLLPLMPSSVSPPPGEQTCLMVHNNQAPNRSTMSAFHRGPSPCQPIIMSPLHCGPSPCQPIIMPHLQCGLSPCQPIIMSPLHCGPSPCQPIIMSALHCGSSPCQPIIMSALHCGSSPCQPVIMSIHNDVNPLPCQLTTMSH